MNKSIKNLLLITAKHIAVILFFLLLTVVYFSPEFFENKVLSQHDVTQFKGGSQDLRNYYNEEGQSSAWTGGMFSGMPSYQIGIWGGSFNFLDYLEKPLKILNGSTSGPVFTSLLMTYLILIILGFNIPIAIFGAIAYSFSSYNIVILDAGHVTKAWALAYMPLVVGGILVMYKKKYMIGGLCMALGLALQIKSNHLQMTYYTAILCVILYLGLIVNNLRDKDIKSILHSSGILAVAVSLALLTNAQGIYSNYEMSKTSTRGKSELTKTKERNNQVRNDGLEKDYVFAWSYGKAETLSLLIPNIHGGSSVSTLDASSNMYKQMIANGFSNQISPQGVQVYTYWGDQPTMFGSVYFGAIVCFLFLLGLIIIRSPVKWLLFISLLFFIFLSWGRNLEFFNDFFYYYFPLYSKFRAVSQALVIPALLIVIIAVWAIKEFFSKNIDKSTLNKALYISLGFTGGICLLLWILPSAFFDFISVNDMQWKEQVPEWFFQATVADRKEMLSSDALRSLVFILLAFLTMWYVVNKTKGTQAVLISVGILSLLTLVDLWNVDKRYVNNDKFTSKQVQTTFKKTTSDEFILQDKDLSYRVLNLNNTFSETATSYYHKSIGGYHAAKLQRYQQLIDYRLQPEIKKIYTSFQTQNIDSTISVFADNTAMNMLNTRYIVYNPEQHPLINPYALGNAWFVRKYKFADNADAEIESLDTLDIRGEAIIDKRFESNLNNISIQTDSTASIILEVSKPNILVYKTEAKSDQLAVFSEIYYENGWNAYIDGKLTPHFRANWTLRAMIVPSGKHEIVFKFEPKEYYISKWVSTISSAILILILIGSAVICYSKFGRKNSIIKKDTIKDSYKM